MDNENVQSEGITPEVEAVEEVQPEALVEEAPVEEGDAPAEEVVDNEVSEAE